MNRNYKKSLTLLLAFSLVALASCSATETEPQASEERTHLTLWHYYNNTTKDALDVIVTEFNDTVGVEKNIYVEAFSHSSVDDLANALISAAKKEVGKEDLPDIFSAYGDTALLLNDLGAVASLDPYFTEEELALYQQDFLNEGRFDQEESLQILPVAKSSELIFLNNTDYQVFAQETGVEMSQMETWEGLAEVAEIYYHWTDAQTPDIENDGSAFFGLDSETNFMLVTAHQMGESMYYSEDGAVRFGLSEDSARKIWDTMMVPYIKGYYGTFGSYRSDDVRSGDILAYAGSTSSVYYFPNTVEKGRADGYDIEGITIAYPYFEDGEKIAVQQGAGMVVSKSTETQEAAAAEFLKWFTAAEYNLTFAVSTGYIPVQNEALKLEGVMEVLEATTEGEVPIIVSHSMEVIYDDLLENYEFYASKPFHGSYDGRNAIRDSVRNTISENNQSYKDLTEGGMSRDEAIAQLSGEENFKIWYQGLGDSIDNILADYQE